MTGLRRCDQVEAYLWPRPDLDWLANYRPAQKDQALRAELINFRAVIGHWLEASTQLPIDQLILTIAQDLYQSADLERAARDLALAHKLAVVLRQVSDEHPAYRLPDLAGELDLVASNAQRFSGFGEDDLGFTPRPGRVTNRLWQAVNLCTARRAITLLFECHAQAVLAGADGSFQTYNFREWKDFSQQQPLEESIRTVSFRIRVPRVILLLLFDRLPKKEVKFTRRNIFERDRDTWQYCGRVFDRRDLNLDHVIPRDRGGPMTWENIVCSCIECNTQKANQTPQEAGMRLIRKPKLPKWRPFVQVNVGLHCHESWKHFLDLAYYAIGDLAAALRTGKAMGGAGSPEVN